jgi:hypothetical protein
MIHMLVRSFLLPHEALMRPGAADSRCLCSSTLGREEPRNFVGMEHNLWDQVKIGDCFLLGSMRLESRPFWTVFTVENVSLSFCQ